MAAAGDILDGDALVSRKACIKALGCCATVPGGTKMWNDICSCSIHRVLSPVDLGRDANYERRCTRNSPDGLGSPWLCAPCSNTDGIACRDISWTFDIPSARDPSLYTFYMSTTDDQGYVRDGDTRKNILGLWTDSPDDLDSRWPHAPSSRNRRMSC